MKVLMKSIEMIAWFTKDGVPNPIKFRILDKNNNNLTIPVDKIILREENRLAGNRMLVYRCESTINGVERTLELKYEVKTCKWFLAGI